MCDARDIMPVLNFLPAETVKVGDHHLEAGRLSYRNSMISILAAYRYHGKLYTLESNLMTPESMAYGAFVDTHDTDFRSDVGISHQTFAIVDKVDAANYNSSLLNYIKEHILHTSAL